MALFPGLCGNALSVSSLSGMLALGLNGSPNTGPRPLLSLTLQGALGNNMSSLVELVLSPHRHLRKLSLHLRQMLPVALGAAGTDHTPRAAGSAASLPVSTRH